MKKRTSNNKLNELLAAGQMCANVCYNLAQRDYIPKDDAWSMTKAYKSWDSAQTKLKPIKLSENMDVILSCRDHWKTSFKHERKNVIRLRRIISKIHGKKCICRDCELFKGNLSEPKQ